MPGNVITVNGEEWYVYDSKMPQFMEVLKQVGILEKKGEVKPEDRPYSDQDWFTEGYDKGIINGISLAQHAVRMQGESIEEENKERVAAYMKRRPKEQEKEGILEDSQHAKNSTEAFNHGYIAGYNQCKVDNKMMTQKEADDILHKGHIDKELLESIIDTTIRMLTDDKN